VSRSLRVLIVEDSPDDAEMLCHELGRAGFEVTHRQVQTADAMRDELMHEPWDIVVSDFSMPQFSALAALSVLRETGIDVPFIIVSGTIGEETAVEALKHGANDFLTKARLSRLGPAIERELREAAGRRDRRAVEQALSETKDRAQFALEAAGVGTWETDLTTGATRWSDMLEQLHGLPAGGFKGTFDAFIDLVDPDDRQRVRDAITLAARGAADSHFEYRVTWPDGSLHWIEGIGRTLHGSDERPPKAAGIGLDVTDKKDLEEQLRQAQKMEAVGRLAGGIAHDFNNLLTAITGYSELLLERVADKPDLAADLEQIKKAGDRAAQLTSQLLAFSRKQPIAPRILDLNQVIGDLEKMLGRVIGEDVALEITAAPSLGLTKADPSQVEQVLMNLVVNARDAMPRGGKLNIRTANAVIDSAFARRNVGAVPGRYVSLTVTDSGCGMKPDVLARAFEPFFTTKAIGKGTGLGLSTVYGIVRQNGGYMNVDSAPGKGTTFTIYWPLVDEPLESLSAARASAATLKGHETVLLVEDDAAVRTLVLKILERYEYEVLPARDASEAIAIEERHGGSIHLLLTDIVMPGLNGPDLAQRLVGRRPGIEVLYMSGFAHRAGGIGSVSRRTGFLQKPFDSETLVAKVRECLDRHAGSQHQERMPQ
jgi:two-component system, cell cycle sensor histidine kinase and response regulator CckA